MAIPREQLDRPWPCLRVLLAIDGLQHGLEQAAEPHICVWSRDVHNIAGTNRATFNHATKTLLERGYVERCYYTGEDKRKHGGYRITAAGRQALATGWNGKAGSRPAQLRPASGLPLRVWTAMRACTKFSVDELETLCGQGHERGLRKQITRYLGALLRAGYVVPVRAAKGKYLLVRSTGPDAPLLRQRRGQLADPNNGAVYALTGGGAA